MKSKATSFGIAALMVLMAFCCVSVTDEVDAYTTTLTGMHFDTDDSEKSRLFTVNEGEFHGYAYTVSIGVATFNGNTDPSGHVTLYVKNVEANGTSNTPIDKTTTIDKSTVGIIKDDNNKGSYNIKINRNTQDQFSYTLDIKIDMTVTVGSVVVTMESIHLRMSVSTSQSNEIHPTLNSMDFQVGKYGQIRVSEHTASALGSIDLYHWYAEGLPEGLSMSENGYVSGIAEAADTVTAKVYIFGHEGNGEYTADLTINVDAATNDPINFKYEVKGCVNEFINSYDYVAVEGSELKLILTPYDPSGSIKFTVGFVDSNNKKYSSIPVTLNNSNVGECTLTANGTGCYKVNVVYEKYENDSLKVQETKFFHIYVIPAFDVVQAQMTIASS